MKDKEKDYFIVYCPKCGRQEYKNKMVHSMVDGKICRICANKEISKLNKDLMLKTLERSEKNDKYKG